MKISLWTKYGALNSKPVFDAFAQGAAKLGYNCRENVTSADVDVIWSVLWRGRMQGNLAVWNRAKQKNKPIIVLEVGAIQRNKTWKMAVNGITYNAYYAFESVDETRIKKLGLHCKPWTISDGNVLIAGQHRQSQQWDTPDHMDHWLDTTLKTIRQNTDKKIILRPHPRCAININTYRHISNLSYQQPYKQFGSYDNYDLSYDNISCVVNYSSNPGVLAALAGVPVFVGNKSLAWPVSNESFDTLDCPTTPDRSDWLKKISYTEWTIDEISTGYPLSRLTAVL